MDCQILNLLPCWVSWRHIRNLRRSLTWRTIRLENEDSPTKQRGTVCQKGKCHPAWGLWVLPVTFSVLLNAYKSWISKFQLGKKPKLWFIHLRANRSLSWGKWQSEFVAELGLEFWYPKAQVGCPATRQFVHYQHSCLTFGDSALPATATFSNDPRWPFSQVTLLIVPGQWHQTCSHWYTYSSTSLFICHSHIEHLPLLDSEASSANTKANKSPSPLFKGLQGRCSSSRPCYAMHKWWRTVHSFVKCVSVFTPTGYNPGYTASFLSLMEERAKRPVGESTITQGKMSIFSKLYIITKGHYLQIYISSKWLGSCCYDLQVGTSNLVVHVVLLP